MTGDKTLLHPKSHYQRAVATFNIEIDGKNAGHFQLTLNHNTNTDSIAYKQNNSMTSISWGKAKKVIAKETLIGKSASLYRTKQEDEYILSIH